MDISKCSNQIESEVQAIKELFSNNVKLEGPIRSKHWADKTKKSWFDTYEFKFRFPFNLWLVVIHRTSKSNSCAIQLN